MDITSRTRESFNSTDSRDRYKNTFTLKKNIAAKFPIFLEVAIQNCIKKYVYGFIVFFFFVFK